MSKSMEDSYLILQIRGLKDHSHGPIVSFKWAGEISESLVSPPELQCLSWWLTDGTRSAQARL